MNKITFEQVFYGHNGMENRILGTSQNDLSAKVVEICESVGTPVDSGEVKPFLISVPSDGNLIMICGRSGRPDNSRRPTLFFHALITSVAEADRIDCNALSIFEKGGFEGTPDPRPGAKTLPFPDSRDFEPAQPKRKFEPFVFISKSEKNRLVRDFTGTSVNHLKWAGFSFQPLRDFDVYVLSDTNAHSLPLNHWVRDLDRGTFQTVKKPPEPTIVRERKPAESKSESQKKEQKSFWSMLLNKSESTESSARDESKPSNFGNFTMQVLYLMLCMFLMVNCFLCLQRCNECLQRCNECREKVEQKTNLKENPAKVTEKDTSPSKLQDELKPDLPVPETHGGSYEPHPQTDSDGTHKVDSIQYPENEKDPTTEPDSKLDTKPANGSNQTSTSPSSKRKQIRNAPYHQDSYNDTHH